MRYGKYADKAKRMEYVRLYNIRRKDFIREQRHKRYLKNKKQHKEYCRKYHIKNRETIINRVKLWRVKNIERSRKWSREYQRKKKSTKIEKFRVLARSTLMRAIKKCIVKRPSKCQICCIKCVPHGHHTDYSKPLKVMWLCPLCHKNQHRLNPHLTYRSF